MDTSERKAATSRRITDAEFDRYGFPLHERGRSWLTVRLGLYLAVLVSYAIGVLVGWLAWG